MKFFSKLGGLAVALFMLSVLFSCERVAPEIDFKQSTNIDFQNIVDKLSSINDAIINGNLSLAEKMAILEAAVQQGTLTQKEGYEKLVEAINYTANSMEAKMELLKEALASQTTSLSDKLGILEAAMQAGITTGKENTALLIEALAEQVAAIQAQTGSIESILDSIGCIIADGNTDLAAKLALLEAAVQTGITSQEESTAQMIEAINAMSDSTVSRLDQINDALKSGNLDITTALALIDATIQSGIASEASHLSLISSAIGSVGLSLANKIALIQKAVDDGTLAQTQALGLIETAVGTLDKNIDTAIVHLQKAIQADNVTLASKLDLINVAITKGLIDDDKAILGLVKDAIDGLEGTVDLKLEALLSAINGSNGIIAQLVAISASVDALGATDGVLALIKAALTDIDGGIDDIKAAIAALPGTEGGQTTFLELLNLLAGWSALGIDMKLPEVIMDKVLLEANKDNLDLTYLIYDILVNPKINIKLGDATNYSATIANESYMLFIDDIENGKVRLTKACLSADITISSLSSSDAYNIKSVYIDDFNNHVYDGTTTTGSTTFEINDHQVFDAYKYDSSYYHNNWNTTIKTCTFKATFVNNDNSKNITTLETCIRRRGDGYISNPTWLNVDIASSGFFGTLEPICASITGYDQPVVFPKN